MAHRRGALALFAALFYQVTRSAPTRATSGFSKLRRTEAPGCADRLSGATSRSASAVVTPLRFSCEAAEYGGIEYGGLPVAQLLA
jgi:hypothetical protein